MKALVISDLARFENFARTHFARNAKIAFSKSAEAVVAFERSEPNLVLIDAPVEQAAALCQLCRRTTRASRPHLLVGLECYNQETVAHLLNAGADDWIILPCDEGILEARLRLAFPETHRQPPAPPPSSGASHTGDTERRLRSFAVNSAEAIALLDPNGRILFAGPTTGRLLGYDDGELVGRNAVDLVHPGEQAGIRELIAALKSSHGRSQSAEFRFQRRDQRWEWLAATGTNLLAESAVGGILVNFRVITGEKQAEEDARKSESRFRLLFDTAPLGIVLSRKEVLLYVNQAYAEMFGYSDVSELNGTSLLAQLAPQCRSDVAARIELRARGEPVPSSYETLGLRKDQSQFPIQIVVARIPLPDGPATVAFISDIAERKEADEMLRLLESAVQQATEAILITSAEVDWPGPSILFVNQAFTQMTGYSAGEAIGKTPRMLQGPKTDPNVLARLRRDLALGQHSFGQTVNYRKNGSEFQVEWQIAPIRNARGVVTHFVSTQKDITNRHDAEAENQKLAAFARFNPNPVLEFTPEGKLTYFNEATLEMAKSLNQSDPASIIPPDAAAIIQKCLATGRKKLRHETVIGGRTLSWSFFPITASQVVHCYAGDITERLSLESQLRQSQKMESIGQLAAGVAHDFNNILTVIQGFTGLLLSDYKDPKMTEPLAQISVAAERAANLTRQLLTFSRKQVMQSRVLDLNEVINNVTKMLRRLVGEDIALQCNYGSGLPLIYADSGMIEQIIMNLAVNARDAMPKGGQLTISTCLIDVDEQYRRRNSEARLGNFVCLTVSDTGYGMDEATLARIFEPFFTTKEVGKGTGLGLATVYGIVKQHDGWVEVGSRPGEGTTFNVVLPINKRTGDTVFLQKPQVEISRGSESILIVEDEPALRGLAHEILRRYGYKVMDAGSGREALHLWKQREGKIDLVISDMVMPGGMSGAELIEKLRAEKPDIKVIFTSGYSVDIINQELSLKENFNFLQKPYGPSSLLGLVRKVLDSHPTDLAGVSGPAAG